jgi:hypothetical protein
MRVNHLGLGFNQLSDLLDVFLLGSHHSGHLLLIKAGEVRVVLHRALDVIGLKVILLTFLHDHAWVQLGVPVDLLLEGGLARLSGQVKVTEWVMRLFDLLLAVFVVVRLVEEESIPGSILEKTIEGD